MKHKPIEEEAESIFIPDICRGSVRIEIAKQRWPDFACDDVSCSATLAFDGCRLMALFEVAEPEVRREVREINGRVCQDSCVEIFLQNPDIGEEYVNFEFSASGACLAARGKGREDRELFSPELIRRIEIRPSLSECGWRLYVCIPLDDFMLAGHGEAVPPVLRGNFYKCGDMLKRPHYLAWNLVDSPKPDFHRPESFGRLLFVREEGI